MPSEPAEKPAAADLPELRPLTAEDFAFAWDLHKRALGPWVAATWGWDEADQERRFRESFRPGARQVLRQGGADLGCLGLETRAGHLYLAYLALRPEAQGRGLGTRIVAGILEDADRRGLPLRLDVLKANPAVRLYRRLGFATFGEDPFRLHLERRAGSRDTPDGPLPYRSAVGAVLLDSRGLVLAGRKPGGGLMWQLPQGGVKKHESRNRALRRELAEELGTDRIELLSATAHPVRYEFPRALRLEKRRRGQELRFYLGRFRPGALPDLARSEHEFVELRWLPPGELVAQVFEWKQLAYATVLRDLGVLPDPPVADARPGPKDPPPVELPLP